MFAENYPRAVVEEEAYLLLWRLREKEKEREGGERKRESEMERMEKCGVHRWWWFRSPA